MSVDAATIVRMLAERHARDITVIECPLEPYGGLRADLWAMRPSWSKPMVTIYEVKVSRSDFLRDDKWMQYMPYCNQLSFATAPGVLDPAELPEQVGLLELTKTGTMLRVVRKAHVRQDDHQALAQVTKAILMNRVWSRGHLTIATEVGLSKAEKIQRYRDRVEASASAADWASKRIRYELAQASIAVKRAENMVAGCAEFRAKLREHGIDPDGSTWRIEKELSDLTRTRIGARLDTICENAQAVVAEIQRLSRDAGGRG